MLMTLDIGNSHIFGGVFDNDQLLLRFRYDSKQVVTSDQLGIFLKMVLRENKLDAEKVSHIALCSVVPSLDYSIRSACLKYFNLDPFVLQAGVKTGLNIKYRNPLEVGADRIANAIAATKQFPEQALIIIDLGTATTFCAVNEKKHYLGGVIMPGMKVSMMALENSTAKLSAVNIERCTHTIGASTADSIQSGIFHGHRAALANISQQIANEQFKDEKPVIIGTGGFSHLFENDDIFSVIIPDLSLHGLRIAYDLNN